VVLGMMLMVMIMMMMMANLMAMLMKITSRMIRTCTLMVLRRPTTIRC
jgi:hypothetical protein